jgi:hypothetical protein
MPQYKILEATSHGGIEGLINNDAAKYELQQVIVTHIPGDVRHYTAVMKLRVGGRLT